MLFKLFSNSVILFVLITTNKTFNGHEACMKYSSIQKRNDIF